MLGVFIHSWGEAVAHEFAASPPPPCRPRPRTTPAVWFGRKHAVACASCHCVFAAR